MFNLQLLSRNVPLDELICDLQRVARLLEVPTLSQALYRRHGQYSPVTYPKRFGGWNAALMQAGLQPSRNFRVDADAVLQDIRRVADLLHRQHIAMDATDDPTSNQRNKATSPRDRQAKTVMTLSGVQYVAHGHYSLPVIYRLFGNWQKAVKVAGLVPTLYRIQSDEELFTNLQQLWLYLKRQPRSTDISKPLSRFGLSPYYRRFGSYNNTLQAFARWVASQPADYQPSDGRSILPIDLSRLVQHKTSRIVNARLRYQVLSRDHFRCQACGRSPAIESNVILQVDHKKPWSHGGETVKENLQTLCQVCNNGKSND